MPLPQAPMVLRMNGAQVGVILDYSYATPTALGRFEPAYGTPGTLLSAMTALTEWAETSGDDDSLFEAKLFELGLTAADRHALAAAEWTTVDAHGIERKIGLPAVDSENWAEWRFY